MILLKTTAPAKDGMPLKDKTNLEKMVLKGTKEIGAKAVHQQMPAASSHKSTGLMRPAQRPLSAAIQKSALPAFDEPFAPLQQPLRVPKKQHTPLFKETDDVVMQKAELERQLARGGPINPLDFPFLDPAKKPISLQKLYGGEGTNPAKKHTKPALPLPGMPDSNQRSATGELAINLVDFGRLPPPGTLDLNQRTATGELAINFVDFGRLPPSGMPDTCQQSYHRVLPRPTFDSNVDTMPQYEEAVAESVTLEKGTNGVSIVPQESQGPLLQGATKNTTAAAFMDPIEVISPPSSSQVESIFAPINAVQTKSDDLEEFLPALETQADAVDPYKEIKDAIKNVKAAQSPAVNEIDEYFDDEEEEEYFDAEGYTTARSFRSKGDNTTGGMTIAFVPRVTLRTERELATAKIYVESTRSEEDIDDEAWDTSMVAEYGEEIFQYMKELEDKMRPNPFYMDNQTEIQWSMRAVLIDWLTQVHNRFQLLPETLFLAVNYIDRFLSCKIVSLGKLQLVGATALFVAAKYEEINCPSVQEIVYMVDGGYTMEEILKAERFMLSMLQFELGWPGPMSFLRRISKADDYDLETRTLAKYFLEVTIMDERFVACAPSYTAAAAHCLARLMLRKGDWSLSHVHYSQYTYSQLRHLLIIILECCKDQKKHHAAVFEKYTDKRYKKASIFVESEMEKGFSLPPIKRDSSINGYSQSWRRK